MLKEVFDVMHAHTEKNKCTTACFICATVNKIQVLELKVTEGKSAAIPLVFARIKAFKFQPWDPCSSWMF